MYQRAGIGLLRKQMPAIAVFFLVIIILIGSSISGLAGGSRPEPLSYKYYTSIAIRRGDTLWSIAKDHMTPEYDGIEEYIKELRRLNRLCDDSICAGEYLTIPQYSLQPVSASASE